jgi:DNA-directed RNA polymerase subunit K/omega
MAYPNISELNGKAENKYALTSLIAKRTRDITEGLPILTNLDTSIPMFAAEDEVFMDYIEYQDPGVVQPAAEEGQLQDDLQPKAETQPQEGAQPQVSA